MAEKKWQRVPFLQLLENVCHLRGDATAARSTSRKKNKIGKGVLRWDRVAKCAFDSSTTRRMTFEISVQHMWRPVKIRKRNGRSNKASFYTASLPSVLAVFIVP